MTAHINASYPVLPLRDIVVFPHMIVPLFVGREKSVRALEEVMQNDKQILLSSQIDPAEDDPGADGIYRTGVLANVLQLLKLPDGTVKVLVEGQMRVHIQEFLQNDNYFEAVAETLYEEIGDADANAAMLRSVAEEFERYAKIKKTSPKRHSLRLQMRTNLRSLLIWLRAIWVLMSKKNKIFLKRLRSAIGWKKSMV